MERINEDQELTLKQRKFVGGYLEGKPLVQAAVEAGRARSNLSGSLTGQLGTGSWKPPKLKAAFPAEKMEASDDTWEAVIMRNHATRGEKIKNSLVESDE